MPRVKLTPCQRERYHRGMSLQEAADFIGMNANLLGQIERCYVRTTIPARKRIAAAYECKETELFGEEWKKVFIEEIDKDIMKIKERE